jgi:hypothetical protein
MDIVRIFGMRSVIAIAASPFWQRPCVSQAKYQQRSQRRSRSMASGAQSMSRSEKLIAGYPVAYWVRLFPFPEPLKGPMLRALDGSLSAFGARVVRLPAGNLAAIATN